MPVEISDILKRTPNYLTKICHFEDFNSDNIVQHPSNIPAGVEKVRLGAAHFFYSDEKLPGMNAISCIHEIILKK